MANLRAALLAAGRGVRMRSAEPKSLIPVVSEQPLLYFILRGLKRAGIDDLLVVTGYRPQDIQSYVSAHWSNGKVAFIRNARYASWGNFHSVRLAADQSPGFNLLVVNSDVIVHPDVYRRTIEAPGDLVLAVERRPNLTEEDMRVELRGDQVRAIGKQLKMVRSHGEYAGVSLLRPDAIALYGDTATALEWRAQTSLYYEDVYAMMLGRLSVGAATVHPGEYAEVDVPEDIGAAVQVVERYRDLWDEPAPAQTA